MPPIDDVTLERLRRSVPLRLSAMGEFHWDDGPVTHPRVIEALRQGLDVSESGEPTVRIGPHWCYLTVDDCILRATAVDQGANETLWLRLDDGRRVPLAIETLWEQPGAGLRCTVPSTGSGRPLSVRFTNQAQMDLSAFVEFDGDRPIVRNGGRAQPIPAHSTVRSRP
jgi:hypothetical protein